MNIISSKVVCEKTLQLVQKSLKSNYINPVEENGQPVKPTKGTPQDSVLSPLLANIVLNELDNYMAKLKDRFEIGVNKARNKEYDKLTSEIQIIQKTQPGSSEIKKLAMERRNIPNLIHNDPNYKRLMYLRYADDFVVLISGSSDDANMIRNQIKDILNKKCGLELNKEKTFITTLNKGFKFIGALYVKTASQKAGVFTNKYGNPSKYRMRMRVMIPIQDLINKLTVNKYAVKGPNGLAKATARKDLVNYEHHEIINFYNQRIQGLLIFYRFASNLTGLRKIIIFLHLSCALTLALKYKLRTSKKIFGKFGRLLKDPETEVSLKIPTSLSVEHYYAGKESVTNPLY
jgi:hypothetical protein